jgi:hypothetical protein
MGMSFSETTELIVMASGRKEADAKIVVSQKASRQPSQTDTTGKTNTDWLEHGA